MSGLLLRGRGPTSVKYGLLYNGWHLSESSSLANTGWHIPTITEWQTLCDYLGASGNYNTNTIGVKLKEIGFTYWQSPNEGATNEVGFNGRGSGARISSGEYSGLKTSNYFLCNIWYDIYMNSVSLGSGTSSLYCSQYAGQDMHYGYSVRLMKDSTSLSNGQTGTYIGNDGQIYPTICIGTQEFISCNLAETKYRNLNTIPEVTNDTDWSNLTTGALCAMDNDWTNVYQEPTKLFLRGSVRFTSVAYGLLYNHWAATDSRNIANTGWKLPNLSEWQTLTLYCDPNANIWSQSNNAGTPLREVGWTTWSEGTGAIEGTNLYGFNARGSGLRGENGTFENLLWEGNWHNSHADGEGGAAGGVVLIWNTNSRLGTSGWGGASQQGHAIRLLKESTSLTHGQTGTYIGNDGKHYPTICIGTQEWTSANLAETKYRNGDSIIEITNTTQWANLDSIILNTTSNATLRTCNASGQVQTPYQSFTVSASMRLSVIYVYSINQVGNPDFRIDLAIYNDNAGVPGSLVYSTQNYILPPYFTFPLDTMPFDFDGLGENILSPGTYWLCFSYSNTVLHNSSNYLTFAYHSTNNYSGGALKYKIGATWYDTGGDLFAKIETGYGAMCAYNNDWSNAYNGTYNVPNQGLLLRGKLSYISIGYGLLYNFYAIRDSRNIASAGWHVPTQAELLTMVVSSGGAYISGSENGNLYYSGGHALREVGTEHWGPTNTGATNSSGFTLLGGGVRTTQFEALKSYTELGNANDDGSFSRYFEITYSDDTVRMSTFIYNRGRSLRLVADSGSPAFYIGNDGKVYPTVTIGDQTWILYNLSETKYRNGDSIPEVTDQTTWNGLTTGALCAYDNDWNNV